MSYEWDARASAAVVTIAQTQTIDATHAPYVFDLTIGFVPAAPATLARDTPSALEGETRVRLESRAASQTFAIPLAAEPGLVRVDPGAYLLADVRFELETDAHVAILRRDPDVVARIRAARALALDGSRAAATALAEALGDPFYGVAVHAARALGETRARWARDLLLAATGHAHPKVRRAIATGLGHFPADSAVARALEAMLGDESYFVVASALVSLGANRADGALERLLPYLTTESWLDTIASGAAAGLAELADPAAVDPLIAATANDRLPQLRRSALRALALLAKRLDGGHPAIVATIERALDDESFLVRRGAVAAAELMEDPATLATLARMMGREQKGGLQRDARDAYDAIQRARRAPAELSSLRRDVEELRRTVADLRAAAEPATSSTESGATR